MLSCGYKVAGYWLLVTRINFKSSLPPPTENRKLKTVNRKP